MLKAQALYAYNVAQNEINIDKVMAKAFAKVSDRQLVNAITEAKTHNQEATIEAGQPRFINGLLAGPVRIPLLEEDRIKASEAFKTIERRAHEIDPVVTVGAEHSDKFGIMGDTPTLN